MPFCSWEARSGESVEQVHWLKRGGFVKTVLGSYIIFFSLTNNQVSINCFLRAWMALNLVLYTEDTTPGLYTETKPHGLPLQCVNAHNL